MFDVYTKVNIEALKDSFEKSFVVEILEKTTFETNLDLFLTFIDSIMNLITALSWNSPPVKKEDCTKYEH